MNKLLLFSCNLYHPPFKVSLNYYITYVFLYHALLMHLTFLDIEGLELSLGIAISLEHPAIFKQNVATKDNNINLFK
ncbi:hypothetical protein COD76_22630 [Bacillus cereus]|nr:hypothetical protein COD76_22630 [Bacillus cereus]